MPSLDPREGLPIAEIVASYRIDIAQAQSALDQVDQKIASIQQHLSQPANANASVIQAQATATDQLTAAEQAEVNVRNAGRASLDDTLAAVERGTQLRAQLASQTQQNIGAETAEQATLEKLAADYDRLREAQAGTASAEQQLVSVVKSGSASQAEQGAAIENVLQKRAAEQSAAVTVARDTQSLGSGYALTANAAKQLASSHEGATVSLATLRTEVSAGARAMAGMGVESVGAMRAIQGLDVLALSGSAGIAALGLGIAAATVEIVKHGAALDQAEAKLQAWGNLTLQQAQLVGQAFIDQAGKTTFGAEETVAALATVTPQLELEAGGALSVAQNVQVMTAAQELAEATGQSLASSTQGLAQVMLVYGHNSQQAGQDAGILAAASELTGVGVEQLAQTVGRLHDKFGPVAPDLQQTATFLVQLEQAGATGSRGIQIIASGFDHLLSGSKPVRDELELLHVSLTNADGSFKNAAVIIAEVAAALQQLQPEARAAAEAILFSSAGGAALYDTLQRVAQGDTTAAEALASHTNITKQANTENETLMGGLGRLRAFLGDHADALYRSGKAGLEASLDAEGYTNAERAQMTASQGAAGAVRDLSIAEDAVTVASQQVRDSSIGLTSALGLAIINAGGAAASYHDLEAAARSAAGGQDFLTGALLRVAAAAGAVAQAKRDVAAGPDIFATETQALVSEKQGRPDLAQAYRDLAAAKKAYADAPTGDNQQALENIQRHIALLQAENTVTNQSVTVTNSAADAREKASEAGLKGHADVQKAYLDEAAAIDRIASASDEAGKNQARVDANNADNLAKNLEVQHRIQDEVTRQGDTAANAREKGQEAQLKGMPQVAALYEQEARAIENGDAAGATAAKNQAEYLTRQTELAKQSAAAQEQASHTAGESVNTLTKDYQELAAVGKAPVRLDVDQTRSDAAAQLAIVDGLTSQITAAAAAGNVDQVKILKDQLAEAQGIYTQDLGNYRTAKQQEQEAAKAAAAASIAAAKDERDARAAALDFTEAFASAGARGVPSSLTGALAGVEASIQSTYASIAAIDHDLSDNTIAPDRRQDLENTRAGLAATLTTYQGTYGEIAKIIQLPTQQEHDLGVRSADLSEQSAALQKVKADADALLVPDQNRLDVITKQNTALDDQASIVGDKIKLAQDSLAASGMTPDTNPLVLSLQTAKDLLDGIVTGSEELAAQGLTTSTNVAYLKAKLAADQNPGDKGAQDELRHQSQLLQISQDKANLQDAGLNQQKAGLAIQEKLANATMRLAADYEKMANLPLTQQEAQLRLAQDQGKLSADQQKAVIDRKAAEEAMTTNVDGQLKTAQSILSVEQAQLGVENQILAARKARAALTENDVPPPGVAATAAGPNTIAVPGLLPSPAAVQRQAQPVGDAIGQGIAAGITQSTPAMQTAMRQAIDATFTTGMDTAGIHSPSARARDEIGYQIPAGMAAGITAGSQLVAAAMSATVASAFGSQLAPLLSAGIPAPTFSGPTPVAVTSAGSTSSTSVSGGDFHVHINNPVVRNQADLEGLKGHVSQLQAAAEAQRRRALGFPNNGSAGAQI